MESVISYINNFKNEVNNWFEGGETLDLSFKEIKKLEKLPEGLNLLKLNGNSLKSMINLPDKLNELQATNNKIHKITKLPSLKKLNLSYNNISLIENLPESLEEVFLSRNKISKIENLTRNITKLVLNNCMIEEINSLPKKLTFLNLENNKIRDIEIPDTMEYLNLSKNDIIVLPKLSNKIRELNISNNRISKIRIMKHLINMVSLNLSSNRIKKIENLPNSIINLDIGENLISKIENIPNKMITLSLSSNNISNANYKYPTTLTSLNLKNNRITNIFTIPKHIINIILSQNYVKEISFQGDILEAEIDKTNLLVIPKIPKSITLINLSETKITKLVDFTIYTNLVTLKLDYLEIKEIIDVPESLRHLSLKGNKIKKIKNIPREIESLNVSYNLIDEIPLALLELRNLNTFTYIGNPIEKHNYVVDRWLHDVNNRGLVENNMVFQDGQNVHNSSIQSSFRNSLGNLLKDKDVLPLDTVLKQIMKTNKLSDDSKELVTLYCDSELKHTTYLVSYSDLLCHVWTRIKAHENSYELIKVLDQELYDGMGLCFTGRLTRLLNVLSGFYHDIEIQIGDNEQISNIIIGLKNKYDNVDLLKAVKKELEERDYPPSVIKEWISYL